MTGKEAENFFKIVFGIGIVLAIFLIVGLFLLILKIMLLFLPELHIMGMTIVQ